MLKEKDDSTFICEYELLSLTESQPGRRGHAPGSTSVSDVGSNATLSRELRAHCGNKHARV